MPLLPLLGLFSVVVMLTQLERSALVVGVGLIAVLAAGACPWQVARR